MFYQRSLLFRFLDGFFRHKLIFFISVVTISVLVAVVLLSKPKTYVGGYTVIEDDRTIPNPLATGSNYSNDDIDQSVGHLQSYISTPSFIPDALRNTDGSNIALDVPIDLSDDTELNKLRADITVAQSANDAFTVTMEYKDANDIKTILSAVIQSFINLTAQEKSAHFSEDVAFIQETAGQFRNKLMASEAALTNFKAENANNLPSEQEAIEGNMASLQSQVGDLQIQLQSASQTVQSLKNQLAQVPATVISNQTATDSPLTTELKTLESQLTTDQVVYQMKSSHPAVVSLVQQIAHLKAKMATMTANGDTESKGLTTTDTSPNPLYQSLQQEIIQDQIAQTALESKMAATEQQLAKATQESAKVPGAQRTLANLQRDYGTYTEDYATMSQRLNEAQVNEQINLRQTAGAYSVLPTSPPEATAGGSKALIMVFGGVFVSIIVGLALVILLEWLDPTLRDPTDTQRVLDLPLLAVLPHSDALLRGEHPENLLAGPTTEITLSKAAHV